MTTERSAEKRGATRWAFKRYPGFDEREIQGIPEKTEEPKVVNEQRGNQIFVVFKGGLDVRTQRIPF